MLVASYLSGFWMNTWSISTFLYLVRINSNLQVDFGVSDHHNEGDNRANGLGVLLTISLLVLVHIGALWEGNPLAYSNIFVIY